MTDKVTNIRDAKGRFPKGISGNPHGVSAKQKAIKDMQRANEVLLTSMVTEMVPHAAKVHRALLKDKNLTTAEALKLIELTYKYGIGTPRQAAEAPKNTDPTDYDDMSPEMIEELHKMTGQMLQSTKDAAPK